MKRNFVVGMFGGLIGSAMLLILLSAGGVVAARGVALIQISQRNRRLHMKVHSCS
jgi:hypothetical protein